MMNKNGHNLKKAPQAWNLAGLFNRWFGRSGGEPDRSYLVKVWDAQREAYRSVNLYDRNDPLWEAAWSIARNDFAKSDRSAA